MLAGKFKWCGAGFVGAMLLLLAACGDGGGGNGNGNGQGGGGGAPAQGTSVGNGFIMRTMADLTNAKAITTSEPAKGTSIRLLYRLTVDGKLEPVLKGFSGANVKFWDQTPSHIIAQGNFSEAYTVNYSTRYNECGLIAIPKVNGMTPVYCLSRNPIDSTYGNSLRPAFDIRGVNVFFGYRETNEVKNEYGGTVKPADNRIVEVRKWDGVSEKTETVFHTDTQTNRSPIITRVFTAKNNENLCFAFGGSDNSDAGLTIDGGIEGNLYCKKEGSKYWKRIPEMVIRDSALKFKDAIITDLYDSKHKFELSTFNFGDRKGEIPDIHKYDLEDGGFIGVTPSYRNSKIIVVDKDGNGRLVAEVKSTITNVVKTGEWLWYFGPEELRRVSIKDGTSEKGDKNYFEDLKGLLTISQINWALGDRLKISGMGSEGEGGLTSVFITKDGGASDPVNSPVVVEHPIDLKWKMTP